MGLIARIRTWIKEHIVGDSRDYVSLHDHLREEIVRALTERSQGCGPPLLCGALDACSTAELEKIVDEELARALRSEPRAWSVPDVDVPPQGLTDAATDVVTGLVMGTVVNVLKRLADFPDERVGEADLVGRVAASVVKRIRHREGSEPV